ncbi:MAG: DNA topoisomerase 4 subunit A [Acidobacteria bacterium]|nr:DNA topoisomerase 4 subunit A [Acidobacteriota bacterium]
MADQTLLPTFAKEVIDVPVAEELSDSFLAYSLSVITSRAIPDARDGLKPVQRRILYSMLNLGVRPNAPHRKCAGVVGDTMGKYHPHGDSAIYETLVRMGQSFSRNITFVDPQGNFGSLDDPPAAYRYTECRLTEAAMEMVRELDEDTVDFRPTFDGERTEPVVLPALIPNLLVNGTTGIAVGMATNMPTHNLREITAAIELVMNKRRPKPTVEELMECVPGPDFPTGGIIVDDGIAEAYTTGRGSIRIRARAEIVELTRTRQGIEVTELPYTVGPERVIAKLQELVRDEKIVGISDFKNLSDRHSGLRLVIECKPGVNPHGVLSELYRLSPLEETFAINNVVLIDGVPTTVGLARLCEVYIDHRLEVIVRRTQFRLDKALDRQHIVEGLLIALDAIDEVVAIIRSSDDASEARERLMERFSLSEIQSTHILDMPLRRLTALEKLKLEEERDDLTADIEGYRLLLGSTQRQRTIVLNELKEIASEYGADRRSEIVRADELVTFEGRIFDEPVIVEDDEPCVVSLSTSEIIGRQPLEGAKKTTLGRHDLLRTAITTSTASTIAAITTTGRALIAHGAEVGPIEGRSRGIATSQLFGTSKDEEVLTIVSRGKDPVVIVTAAGVIKRLDPTEVVETKHTRTVIKLKPDDRVVAAFSAPEGVDVVMVSSDAQVLRMSTETVSVQGRGAGGVSGMKLKAGATVVAAHPVIGDGVLLTVTNQSTAKATPLEEIPTKGRAGGGVRITKLDATTRIELAYVGPIDGLMAAMGSDEDPRKLDPTPVVVDIAITKRDLVSTPTDRQILALGVSRWG